jgi:hypothetical protein
MVDQPLSAAIELTRDGARGQFQVHELIVGLLGGRGRHGGPYRWPQQPVQWRREAGVSEVVVVASLLDRRRYDTGRSEGECEFECGDERPR